MRRKGKRNVYTYTEKQFTKCWTCKNACGKCEWSKEFKPVKGWDAIKTYLPTNGEYADSYFIVECPKYERG